ncbi:co-chaperonin GroES (HSP10) [Pedobacter sp. UYP24]
MTNTLLQYILTFKQDAILFKVSEYLEQAGEDTYAKSMVLYPICEMLNQMSNELLQDEYVKKVSKMMAVKPNIIISQLKKETEKKKEESVQILKENEDALPKWVDKSHYYEHSFVQRLDLENKTKTGIYFSTGESLPKKLTNFTFKAIAHVRTDGDGNRRLAEINNGYELVVIEVPSALWSSPEGFERILNEKGVFYTEDFSKANLTRLKAYFLPQFKPCYELDNLGWQAEGFFAYSNLIYKDKVINYDEYGIADVDGTNFLSMGVSKALEGLRKNKSNYENDKYLTYTKSPISFTQWTELMTDVYLEKGMMGICFVLMACYKDLILSRNNNCPIPYMVGAAQSGKSKFGESISSVFTMNMYALNLNQTTIPALWERLSRFSNVPMLFNEFDENSIKEEITRAFKGAYDNEGRNRATITRRRSETQEVRCLPIIIGQYLTTSDDGAILQRTIPIKFAENNLRTNAQMQRYDELKRLEKEGITSLSCEAMVHRKYLSDNYLLKYHELTVKMKEALASDNLIPKMRILENFVNAMTVTLLVKDKIEMSFTEDEFFEYCKQQIISLSLIISESNALANFWSMMEFLLDEDMIEQGFHFKIETKNEVTVAADRKDAIKKTFSEPKKLLFIRLNTIHTLYQKQMNAINKKPIDKETILVYMKDQEFYIGNSPSGSFRSRRRGSTNTSSFVFDYDMLKINLERFDEKDESHVVSVTGKLSADATAINVLDVEKLSFTIVHNEDYYKEEIRIDQKVYTRCFFKDLSIINNLKINTAVKVTGSLDVKPGKTVDYRYMEVHTIEFTKPEPMKF